jgi:hypothetical protein
MYVYVYVYVCVCVCVRVCVCVCHLSHGIKRQKVRLIDLVLLAHVLEPRLEYLAKRVLERDAEDDDGTTIMTVEIDPFCDLAARNLCVCVCVCVYVCVCVMCVYNAIFAYYLMFAYVHICTLCRHTCIFSVSHLITLCDVAPLATCVRVCI